MLLSIVQSNELTEKYTSIPEIVQIIGGRNIRINFIEFLIIINTISKRLNCNQLEHESEDDKLRVLISTLLHSFFMKSILDYSIIDMNINLIHIDSLVWFSRSSGLSDLQNYDRFNCFTFMVAYAIDELIKVESVAQIISNYISNMNMTPYLESTSKCYDNIFQFAIGCFFTIPIKNQPLYLQQLSYTYSRSFITHTNMKESIFQFLRLYKNPQDDDGWTIRKLENFLSNCNNEMVIHVSKVIIEVLGIFGEFAIEKDIKLPYNDLIDVVFMIMNKLETTNLDYHSMNDQFLNVLQYLGFQQQQGISKVDVSMEIENESKFSAIAALVIQIHDHDNNNGKTLNESLHEIFILLLFYPLNKFSFNPWEIAHLFLITTQQLQMEYEANVINATIVLSKLFQSFCQRYQINVNQLAKFFALRYDNPKRFGDKPQMKSFIFIAIQDKSFHYILADRVIRLLFANADLLKWIYCYCFSKYKSSDPFTEYIHTPFPVNIEDNMNELSCYFLLPIEYLLSWGIEFIGISKVMLQQCIDDILILSFENYNQGVTFSGFILFLLHACYKKVTISGITMTLDSYLESLRFTLNLFSNELTKLQQYFQLKVLSPLFHSTGNNSNNDVKSSLSLFQFDYHLEAQDMNKVLSLALESFNKRSLSLSSSNKYLPPHPPQLLWDVPRFVDFCKFFSLTSDKNIETLLVIWYAFGMKLENDESNLNNTTSPWLRDIVPPTPIRIDIEILVILLMNCVKMLNVKDYNESYNLNGMHYILCRNILPFLCSSTNIEDVTTTTTSSTSKAVKGNTFESILRYGGSEVIDTLDDWHSWLRESYDSLVKQSHHESNIPFELVELSEPSINSVCRFLSIKGLLRIGAVAKEAKLSLQSRLRPSIQIHVHDPRTNNSRSNVITLSFSEFEDLTIRCALMAWEICGASFGKEVSSNEFINQYDKNSEYRPENFNRLELTRIANDYCRYCNIILTSMKNTSSWGVDFLKPFIQLLALNNSSIKKPVSEISFKSKFLSYKMQDKKSSHPESCDLSFTSDIPELNSSIPLSPMLQKSFDHSFSDPIMRTAINELVEVKDNFLRIKSSSLSSNTINQTSSMLISPEEYQSDEIEVLKLLEGTKEALWPVYATYCSCGDSIDPGKLSGPNLFALLSKLGVLTSNTIFSDVGILLHQVSSHSNAHSPLAMAIMITTDNSFESPSLTFEEFLIYLCAFSQLRYQGFVTAPIFSKQTEMNIVPSTPDMKSIRRAHEDWFHSWQRYMSKSDSFRKLLEDCILPMLIKFPVLAYPEDARQRDKYSGIFSIEVLLAVEASERPLFAIFEQQRKSSSLIQSKLDVQWEISFILTTLKFVDLVPQVLKEDFVLNLIKDVIPSSTKSSAADKEVVFPQWEWILCLVAFHAVEVSLTQSQSDKTYSEVS